VFFGERGNADVLTSDSNFLIEDGAAGNIQAPNLKISNGGNIGSVGDPDAISIASDGNVSLTQSLSIAGDLTVNGTTTTVNSTVTTIEDPVIIIGSGAGDGYGGATDDNKDRGIAFAWKSSAGAANGQLGFFGHDDSLQEFVYYTSGTIGGDIFSNGTLGDFRGRWATFAGVSGALVGNADTATEATNVTVTANNSTNETVYLTFVDGATGTQGIETDTALNYNPSSDTLTAGTFAGNLTGNVTGSADTLTNSRFIGASGHAVGSGLFNGSADQVPNIELTTTAILGQTVQSSNDNDDVMLLYDNSSGVLIRQTRGEFLSGLGGGSMDSFTAAGDVGSQTINDGNTLTIIGGSGLITEATATDNITINLKIDQSTLGYTTDVLEVQDGGITATQLATSVAGDGLTGGGGTALAFDISDLATTDTDIAGTDLIAIHDGAQKKITFANFVADIDHDALLNFVGNEHIDHTSVTLTAGDGLSGGGDISTNRTFTVVGDSGILVTDKVHANLVDYTVQTTAANARTTTASRSYAVQVDSSDKLVVNVPWTDTTGGTFSLDGDSGATQTIADGDTVSILGGNGMTTVASATDTVTVDRFKDCVNQTASTLTVSTEEFVLCDANSNAITITLPDNGGTVGEGKTVTVKKTDSTANTVTISRQTADTIDGANTFVLYSQYESACFVNDGSNWHIV
jgi:hypothetical protein